MIKIYRSRALPKAKVYTEKCEVARDGKTPLTKAEKEEEEATVFHTDANNYALERRLAKEDFKFAIYKDPDIRSALNSVFGKKCAYCESHYTHITTADIEHFRPKGRIGTGKRSLRPGYYWLACNWSNLLNSCPDCNRVRHHSVSDQPPDVKLGKGDQFPLRDEKQRVRTRGSITKEDRSRLLLNPCLDDPEQHLAFDEKGLVKARKQKGGDLSDMGRTSIYVYALQRKDLVERRLIVLNTLRARVDDLKFQVRMHNRLEALNGTEADLQLSRDKIMQLRDEITKMLDPAAEYVALLRDWLRGAHTRGEFADLLQFKIDLRKVI